MTIEDMKKEIDALKYEVQHLYELLNIVFGCKCPTSIGHICLDCKRHTFMVEER